MRVLVIGKGGREHAIVRALSTSAGANEIHVVPGNPGMAKEAVCHDLSTSDLEGIGDLVSQKQIELALIGPEAELVSGLADFLRTKKIAVFGPSKEASRLEASKIFAKEFMYRAGVPTAEAQVVSSVEETMREAERHSSPYVLKADGLASGKGVFICESLDELQSAAADLFEKRKLGTAGSRALLEKNLPGWELSVLVLTDGRNYQILPLSQDHKRLGEGQTGPNTGGMGTVAPMMVDSGLLEAIDKQIVAPSVQQMTKEGFDYKGVLFIGVMVTTEGPQVLEYNVRFGDPETQVVLPLLDGDWLKVIHDVATGQLGSLDWKPIHAACVVLAAEGYPESPAKGVRIEGEVTGSTPSSYFLHAGTSKSDDNDWVTAGGRVLNAVGLGSTKKEAMANAYGQAELVNWPGMQLRRDIGSQDVGSSSSR